MADPAADRRWTARDYLDAERSSPVKHVLWDGEIYAMAGASKEHNLLVAALLGELRNGLRASPCRPYASDQRIRVPAAERYVYPDASVTCPPVGLDPEDAHTITNPRLIAEVLSDSTEAFDRGDKWIGYQGIASLSDYLLVSQKTVRIEHYARGSDGSWILRTYGRGETVALASLDIVLAVDAVYDGIVPVVPGG
jgi:Uma2 family endonuclease